MPSMNKVILIGNLTHDPELKYTQSGTAVGKFSIAINHKYKDASGNVQEDVTFVPITVWGAQAENCHKYLTKGRPVAIDGRLRITDYTKDDGSKGKWTEVVASSVQFLGSRDNVQPQANTDQPETSTGPEDEVPF